MFSTHVLEGLVMWTPLAMGIASSSIIAYYGNNFVPTDLALVGTTTVWSGASGNAVMGVSAAALAIESMAILEFFKYMMKAREGKIKVENSNVPFGRAMMYFWYLMLFFYMVAIVSCALNITLVSQFDAQAVSLNTAGTQITGTFSNGTLGMAYTTIGIGGLALIFYLYAELGLKKGSKVVMTETHES